MAASSETAGQGASQGPAKARKKGGVPWWPFLIAAVVLGFGACRFIYRPYKIPSGAMQPTLNIGDHMWVNSVAGDPPRRGEVIVFKYPEDPTKDFVKRAIALPGDELLALDGRPILNGWMTPRCYAGQMSREGHTYELYIEHYGDRSYGTFYEEKLNETACKSSADCGSGVCAAGTCGSVLQGPFKVKANEVWVMGDNRNNTFDSRMWRGGLGAGVPFELIKGSARTIWMSFAPSGGMVSERIGTDSQGPPRLLPGEGLAAEIERCVKARPEVTTPPG